MSKSANNCLEKIFVYKSSGLEVTFSLKIRPEEYELMFAHELDVFEHFDVLLCEASQQIAPEAVEITHRFWNLFEQALRKCEGNLFRRLKSGS